MSKLWASETDIMNDEELMVIDDAADWSYLDFDAEGPVSPCGIQYFKDDDDAGPKKKYALEGFTLPPSPRYKMPAFPKLLEEPEAVRPVAVEAAFDATSLFSAAGGLAFAPVTDQLALDASAAGALADIAAAAGRRQDPLAAKTPAARQTAVALAKQLGRLQGSGDLPEAARACLGLVEAAQGLAADADHQLASLLAPLAPNSLAALATFARVASSAAAKAGDRMAARRRAWRPLAKWRAVSKAAATAGAAAGAAFDLWASLGDKAFGAPQRQSLECRAVASAFAAAASREVSPQDAGETKARELGKTVSELVRRAYHWSADDVRVVGQALAGLAGRGFGAFQAYAAALEAATRRKSRRPAALGAHLEPAPAEEQDGAKALLARVVATATQGAGALLLAGAKAEAYEPAAFRVSNCEARLEAVLAAALCPTLTAHGVEWGEGASLHPDALPPSLLARTRNLVAALAVLAHEPPPEHAGDLEALVAGAERAKDTRAAWLPPYDLRIAGLTMRCRDVYARDAASQTTAYATVVSFSA